MRVLFDTNVLLDALLAREPFVADAAFLLETVESGHL
ncbi:PIN domain-containing protein [Nostoc sp. NOS(2021)]